MQVLLTHIRKRLGTSVPPFKKPPLYISYRVFHGVFCDPSDSYARPLPCERKEKENQRKPG